MTTLALSSGGTIFPFPMSEPFRYERRVVSGDIALWELFGVPTDAEWLGVLDVALRWLNEQESRGKKWGIIIDPSGMPQVPAELRRAAGQWRAQHMPLIANTCRCASYVATNAMLRGAITAVFWFASPVIPVGVRGSQEDAHQWVLTKLNDLSMTG